MPRFWRWAAQDNPEALAPTMTVFTASILVRNEMKILYLTAGDG
jgi:hypothetical protein